MVVLVKGREIDIGRLQEERRQYISEFSGGFQLNEMLLNLSETFVQPIRKIEIYRIEDGKVVTFEDVPADGGSRKNICCSNVLIRVR